MNIGPDEAITAPWWPELLAVKDTLTYAALCERFGVSMHALRRALELAGETKVSMPRGRKPKADASAPVGDPLDRVRARIGRAPDSEIAELAGVSVENVKAYRQEHGIAPFLRPPPSFGGAAKAVVLRRRDTGDGARAQVRLAEVREPVIEAAPVSPLARFHDRLGTVADQVIADEAGVARTAVGAYRREHGIPAYDGFRHRKGAAQAEHVAPAVDGRSQRSTILPYLDILGTTPDSEIAAMARVSAAAVAKFRGRRGIAGYAPDRPLTERPAVEPRKFTRRSKLDAYADIIGVLTDAEVARKAGTSGEAVRAFRKRHGIEAGSRRGVVEEVAVATELVVEAAAEAPVAVEAVEPAAAVEVATPVPTIGPREQQHAFAVVAVRGQERRRFVAVGVNIAEALMVAGAALAARADGPWRVASTREMVEALTASG